MALEVVDTAGAARTTMLVALKTIPGLYDGATTRELDELSHPQRPRIVRGTPLIRWF